MPKIEVQSGRFGVRFDLDHRIIKPGIGRKRGAHRRILGQVDDAVMLVGHVELAFGAHHAVAFHATDIADRQSHIDARHIGARTRQRADQAGARIGCAADDLHRLAVPGIDHKHLELVGIGVLLGGDDAGDGEGPVGRLVVDILDLEPDRGEALADLIQIGVGLKVILEPGEGEFHWSFPVFTVGRSTENPSKRGRSSVTVQERQLPLHKGMGGRRIGFGLVHETQRQIDFAWQTLVGVADLAAAMAAEHARHAARAAPAVGLAEPGEAVCQEADKGHHRRAGLLAAVAAMAIGLPDGFGARLGRDQATAAGAVMAAHPLSPPPNSVGMSNGRKP